MFIGSGTLVNVVTVLLGGALGLLVGDRLPERTRSTITDVLGLFTIVIGALSLAPLSKPSYTSLAPFGAASIIVLLGLLFGAILGSALHLESRIDGLGVWAKQRFGRGGEHRFAEGFVTATLLFCVGPLSILGSFSDGLGLGAQQLYVKAVLDGFAAMAFASAFGAGVLLSAASVFLYQGLLTLAGFALGPVLPDGAVDTISVAGGIILMGLGIRLMGLKEVRVADLLPALVLAPLLLWVAQTVAR